MRLVTFEAEGSARPGVLTESNGIFDLSAAGFKTTLEVIEASVAGRTRIEKFIDESAPDSAFSLSTVKLLAPISRPPKLICVGLNYRDHALESGHKLPDVPTIFNKFSTAIIGPSDNIILPKVSTTPDYEAEFAFVVGKGGRRIAKDKWQDHVFGYTIMNDVSARDYQYATSQFLMGKTFDTFAPIGPWIVTADEIADPHSLDISLEINGEVLQNSNTRELIFKVPELIEFLSSVFTLEPGDIVSTGTPAGVGVHRKPQRLLKAGDDVVVKIPAIGELRNPVVAEA